MNDTFLNQAISYLETNVNLVLKEAFETIKGDDFFLRFEDYFKEVLSNTFDLELFFDEVHLSQIHALTQGAYRKRRMRLYRTLLKKLESFNETLLKDSITKKQYLLDAWFEDKESYFCQLPSFEAFSLKRRRSYLESDLKWFLVRFVTSEAFKFFLLSTLNPQSALPLACCGDSLNSKTRSTVLLDMPVGSTKQLLLDLEYTEGQRYSNYNYQGDDGSKRKLVTIVRDIDFFSLLPEAQRKKMVLKEFRALDEKDLDILSYVYNKASVVDYIKQGYVASYELSITDILRFLGFSSYGSKNYQQIRNRLAKISSYRFQDVDCVNGEEIVTRVFGTFDLKYRKKGDGSYDLNAPVVSLSPDMLEIYMEGRLELPHDKVDLLEDALARLLVFPLYKKRLDLIISSQGQVLAQENEKELIFDTHYCYFESKVRFSKKTISARLKQIYAALDELINKDFLIDSYVVTKKNRIKITFKPLTVEEQLRVSSYFSPVVSPLH